MTRLLTRKSEQQTARHKPELSKRWSCFLERNPGFRGIEGENSLGSKDADEGTYRCIEVFPVRMLIIFAC
jgi:hypothetical protein